MRTDDDRVLAVLIDGDNVSPRVVKGLLSEIAGFGTASVKRIYGDWTKPDLGGWKECLLEHSISPVQQFAYASGKNATDGAMIIDAMDLLHTGRFSGFCLVSSDCDFTRLAGRIREQGVAVYGFGERKTPRPFVAACDAFVYFDVRDAAPERSAPPTDVAVRKAVPGAPPVAAKIFDRTMLEMLTEAVTASAEADGRAHLGAVGAFLAKRSPNFDTRHYGFPRLSDLVAASGIVEVERAGGKPGGPGVVMVRLGGKAAKSK